MKKSNKIKLNLPFRPNPMHVTPAPVMRNPKLSPPGKGRRIYEPPKLIQPSSRNSSENYEDDYIIKSSILEDINKREIVRDLRETTLLKSKRNDETFIPLTIDDSDRKSTAVPQEYKTNSELTFEEGVDKINTNSYNLRQVNNIHKNADINLNEEDEDISEYNRLLEFHKVKNNKNISETAQPEIQEQYQNNPEGIKSFGKKKGIRLSLPSKPTISIINEEEIINKNVNVNNNKRVPFLQKQQSDIDIEKMEDELFDEMNKPILQDKIKSYPIENTINEFNKPEDYENINKNNIPKRVINIVPVENVINIDNQDDIQEIKPNKNNKNNYIIHQVTQPELNISPIENQSINKPNKQLIEQVQPVTSGFIEVNDDTPISQPLKNPIRDIITKPPETNKTIPKILNDEEIPKRSAENLKRRVQLIKEPMTIGALDIVNQAIEEIRQPTLSIKSRSKTKIYNDVGPVIANSDINDRHNSITQLRQSLRELKVPSVENRDFSYEFDLDATNKINTKSKSRKVIPMIENIDVHIERLDVSEDKIVYTPVRKSIYSKLSELKTESEKEIEIKNLDIKPKGIYSK